MALSPALVRTSTKLHIPHPAGDFTLVGVLEQLESSRPTNGRKIALVGIQSILTWTPILRITRRSCMEQWDIKITCSRNGSRRRCPLIHLDSTFGEITKAAASGDRGDLPTTSRTLWRSSLTSGVPYGYEIHMLVGHSRGSVAGMYWLCTSEQGKGVSALVNVSGRYRMHRIYDGVDAYKEQWATKGYFDWNVVVARKPVVQKIYPHDLEIFSRWNSAIVWDKFPSNIDVLTIHGLADRTVPVYDAVIYARAFGSRAPGTHNLHLIEDADHNFTGRQDEIVDCILEWLEAKRARSLVTGVFKTGTRGKL
ncbi:hypothetical protein JVU11DRAFT_3329 [Chiua virens]|nr:hypothetical protein JVU11DRAFT_3329 [Chiua virens]